MQSPSFTEGMKADSTPFIRFINYFHRPLSQRRLNILDDSALGTKMTTLETQLNRIPNSARIKFNGHQSTLILQLKRKTGFTWKNIAELFSVSEHTIRYDWKKEKYLLPCCVVKKISELLGLEEAQIMRHICEIKPANWGRIKGGKNSVGRNCKKINFPPRDEKLAEFVGIMLGDGNIFSKVYPDTIINLIKVAGNPKTERSYLLHFIKPLIESLFNLKVSVYMNKKGNEMFLAVHGKNVVKFVEEIGLPRGNKIKNRIPIPSWIFENNHYLKACIRGLIDTDGSIYPLKPHYPNLLQICFKNRNQKLLEDARTAFQKLGYHPSKITWNKIYLTQQAEIDRYVTEIGFSNPHHLRRYLIVRSTFPTGRNATFFNR